MSVAIKSFCVDFCMKTVAASLLIFGFSFFLVLSAHGQPTSPKRKLGTKFNFEDMMVKGKYQYPDEAITSVEDEKGLNDLLGVRKHFKDRLQQSATRH
jgi:hypothetical protein